MEKLGQLGLTRGFLSGLLDLLAALAQRLAIPIEFGGAIPQLVADTAKFRALVIDFLA